MLGSIIKIRGSVSDVENALAAGGNAARAFYPNSPTGNTTVLTIPNPHPDARNIIISTAEYNALIEQPVVKYPHPDSTETGSTTMSSPAHSYALGFIETQGFTAVFEAIDTACKSASVEVVGKEKLGGGYVTVVIRGDVAAVSAAIDAAKPRVEGLGKLIACHVIARPSAAALSLLPK